MEQLNTKKERMTIGDLLDLGRLEPTQFTNGNEVESKIRETMSRLYEVALIKSDKAARGY